MFRPLRKRLRDIVVSALEWARLRQAARRLRSLITRAPVVQLNRPPQEIFSAIYHKNYWGSQESKSGTGSTLERTRQLREDLRRLFAELQIRTVLDAACGDFAWMRELNLEAADLVYTGVDIVPELISDNRRLYESRNVRFEVRNIISDRLPVADLVICRDCLVHLSDDHVWMALANIVGSGSRYLLTTSFCLTRKNPDIPTGDWRPLNLLAAPFTLGEPLRTIWEKNVEAGYEKSKTLVLFDAASLQSRLAVTMPNGSESR
jgi:SAM-dependent methyltransferase